jgi:hypothetical protein
VRSAKSAKTKRTRGWNVANRICGFCEEDVPQGEPLFDIEYSFDGGPVYHVLACGECYCLVMEDRIDG